MPEVGESHPSAEIITRHWNQNIILTASRHGAAEWQITRSDTGKTDTAPDLETKVWTDGQNFAPDRRIYWSGNEFQIYDGNGNPIEKLSYLNYFGADAHAGLFWQAVWDLRHNVFIHTLKRKIQQ